MNPDHAGPLPVTGTLSAAASADLPSLLCDAGKYLNLGIQKGTVQLQPSRSAYRYLAGPRAMVEPSLLWRFVCMNQIDSE
jgi:hypothetical protein